MLPAPGNRIAPQGRLPTPGSLKGQLTHSWFHCGGPQVQPTVVTAGLALCGHGRVSNSRSDCRNKQPAMPHGEMQCGLERGPRLFTETHVSQFPVWPLLACVALNSYFLSCPPQSPQYKMWVGTPSASQVCGEDTPLTTAPSLVIKCHTLASYLWFLRSFPRKALFLVKPRWLRKGLLTLNPLISSARILLWRRGT